MSGGVAFVGVEMHGEGEVGVNAKARRRSSAKPANNPPAFRKATTSHLALIETCSSVRVASELARQGGFNVQSIVLARSWSND